MFTIRIPRTAPRLRIEEVLIAPPDMSKFAYKVERLTEAIKQAAGMRAQSLWMLEVVGWVFSLGFRRAVGWP